MYWLFIAAETVSVVNVYPVIFAPAPGDCMVTVTPFRNRPHATPCNTFQLTSSRWLISIPMPAAAYMGTTPCSATSFCPSGWRKNAPVRLQRYPDGSLRLYYYVSFWQMAERCKPHRIVLSFPRLSCQVTATASLTLCSPAHILII